MTTGAAVVFALAAAVVIAFQIALALGAPWGAYAMGGRFPGRYPPRLRLVAVVQAAIVGLLAAIVLSAGDLALPDLSASFPWAIWLVVAFSGVSVAVNAITPSAPERRIWLPVAVVMLVTSLIVAVTA